jgi:hypothetical protein
MDVLIDGLTHSLGKVQESINDLSTLDESQTIYMKPMLEDYASTLHAVSKGLTLLLHLHHLARPTDEP